MRHLKKMTALLVAVVMMMALSAVAFAAGTGTITITPPSGVDSSATNTYKIYKVFDADGDGTNISYKLVDSKTTAPAGFKVDDAGNVTYDGAGTATELTANDIAAIAAYVTEGDLVATVTSTGTANAVSDALPNGYYYITTSVGTVVTIDSTNPTATVKDKNTVPTVDKKITGASSYDPDGKKALAQVGTEVTYTATVTVGKGSKGLKFHDKMGAGLVFVADSISVKGADGKYTIQETADEGDTITISFDDGIAEGTEITVEYKAKVTSDALQDDPAKNTATVSYGDESKYTSQPSETEVYNAKFTVTKKDGNGAPLAGAGFVIAKDGKYYKFADGVVTWETDIDNATQYTSDENGAVQAFTGLANGEYTLIEKTVPAGYNKAADSTFTVKAGDYSADNLKQESTVTNNAGTELPSTGGMGTTILYIVGAVLVIGAVVLLITRRRLNAEK